MKNKLKLDYTMIRAAGSDAGNRAMRAAGRLKWNKDDYNIACAESNRLTKISDALPDNNGGDL